MQFNHLFWNSAQLYGQVLSNILKSFQIAQDKAARLALHGSFHAEVCRMHTELPWLTVETRIKSYFFHEKVSFE